MNIGIFCGSIGSGGSQNTTVAMARELARRGHAICLFVDQRRFRPHDYLDACEVVDLPVHRLASGTLGGFSVPNVLRARRRLRRGDLDVLLAITPWTLPLMLWANPAGRIPMVYYALSCVKGSILRAFGRSLVANSPETRARLAAFLQVDPDSIGMVKERIEIDRLFSTAPQAERRVDSSFIRVLMMSRVEHEKTAGIIMLIRALRDVVANGYSVTLDLVGGGRDLTRVSQYARDACRGREGFSVVCHGRVDDPAPLIRGCDIAVGIGRCAWEPMAAGKPTLVLGQEGYAGLVSPESAPSLIQYNFTARGPVRYSEERLRTDLADLIGDPLRRRQLGDFGHSFVRNEYDIKVGAAKMEALLDQAIGIWRTDATSRKRLHYVLPYSAYLYLRAAAVWLFKPKQAIYYIRRMRALAEATGATPSNMARCDAVTGPE